MQTFSVHGIAASSGIAIGKVQLVSNALQEVEHYKIKKSGLDSEINRLSKKILRKSRRMTFPRLLIFI
jgi:phosphotransferase system enzyme I (PtsI)